MSINHGIFCDLCRKKNFSGRRYKCLICKNFDLCSICYENQSNLSFHTHSHHHPMQLIITTNDYEHIYFGFKRTEYSPLSLICPLCNENGFSVEFLIKHIDEKHFLFKYSVLCPICFIRENNLVEHLHQHINEKFNVKKQISNLNEKSLLKKLIQISPNKKENQQRSFFIHYLLTDLLNQNSFNKNI